MYWNVYNVGHITDPKVQRQLLVQKAGNSFPQSADNLIVCQGNIINKIIKKSQCFYTSLQEEDSMCSFNFTSTQFRRFPSLQRPVPLVWEMSGNVLNESMKSFLPIYSQLMSRHESADDAVIGSVQKNLQVTYCKRENNKKSENDERQKPFKCNILDKALPRKSICF